jgi:glycosyltransferase involved in cell wall biosynthesis
MKILLINKFYHDKGKAGGVGRHILELQKLLEKNGHEVVPFGMRQKETVPNDYLDFFSEEFDLGEIKFSPKSLKNIFKVFRNREAIRKLERLIKKTKPDVAHIHNIYHHLSPAILPILKKNGIPVVMTVHDYKLVCPNYLMFNKGKVCEKCSNGKYYKCFTNKCVKNSYAASFILALEAYFAKLKKYYSDVDLFITPSKFMHDKLIENGIKEKKVKFIPNFFDPGNFNAGKRNAENEKYFLYFGRLSKEKGVDILVKSLQYINFEDYKLKIVGSGEEKENLEALADGLSLGNKVEFVDYKNGEELHNLISRAEFAVVPSIWFENAPYSILEAFAFGKPVIGARIGGIPEMIKENETGLTFEAGDERDLAAKIQYILNNRGLADKLGKNAKSFLEDHFNPENYYQEIASLYSRLKQA